MLLRPSLLVLPMVLSASLLVLPMVLASTTVTSRNVNCEFTVVEKPKSLLGHSKVHQPPVEEYQADGIQDCMDVCCNVEFMCNVGLFLDHAHKHDTNCLLYSCYPLDSCSPKIRKGTEVFIDRPSLEGEEYHYQEPTVSPYEEIYSDQFENQEDDAMDDVSPSDVNNDDVYKDDDYKEDVYKDDVYKDGEEDTDNAVTSSSQTVEETTVSQIASSDSLSIMASLSELTSSSEFAIEATATIADSNSEESLPYFADMDTTLEANSASDILSSSFEVTSLQPTTFDTSVYLYRESLSTAISEQSNDAYLDITHMVDLSVTGFDSQLWDVTATSESSASYRILEETSIATSSKTLFLENSPFETELSSSWLLLESSDTYTVVAGEDDSDLSIFSGPMQPIEPTETFDSTTPTQEVDAPSDSTTPTQEVDAPSDSTTPTQEVDAPSDFTTHVIHNETSFENYNAGQEAVEPVTAILICILTVGCVFALAIVGVLGVRLYEGYRKRHYSRLDYLINGMYS